MPSSGGRGRQETVSCEEREAAVLLVLLLLVVGSDITHDVPCDVVR